MKYQGNSPERPPSQKISTFEGGSFHRFLERRLRRAAGGPRPQTSVKPFKNVYLIEILLETPIKKYKYLIKSVLSILVQAENSLSQLKFINIST